MKILPTGVHRNVHQETFVDGYIILLVQHTRQLNIFYNRHGTNITSVKYWGA